MIRIPTLRLLRPHHVLVALILSLALLAAACGSSTATVTAEATLSDEAMSDNNSAQDADGDDHSSHDDGGHDHGAGLEVPEGMPVPGIDISVVNDPIAGQNLTVSLTNFEVTPEQASLAAADGGGHMHLYVNGERAQRFYNDALHLELPPGDHMIEVELSANDHQAWLQDGSPIRAMARLTVPEADGDPSHDHDHGHDSGNGGEVAWDPAPAISALTVEADPKSGWNVHATVDNFELSAANASTDPVDGQGHMHLYVNGKKITRLYGEWHLLPELAAGENEVTVELNANDHTPLTIDSLPISRTVIVMVDDADATMAMGDDPKQHGDHDDDHGDHGDDHGDHGDDHDDDNGDHHPEDDAMMMEEGAIVLGLLDGEVITERDRYEVAKGDTVVLLVDSDVVEEVHVHGYDLHLAVGPDLTARLAFEASVSGVFEIEFEESGRFLAELLVR